MIKVKKCPKHLLDVLDFTKFEKISIYKNGMYLKAKEKIFYVSHFENLNALSIQVDKSDLEQIKLGGNLQRLNFIIDGDTTVVDLHFPKIVDKIPLNILKETIESKNPITGLNGKNESLINNSAFLEKINPLINPNEIIGRGLGLTPSGDDILIGILFVLFSKGKEQQVDKIKLEASLSRTNDISREFLQYALKGIFSESLLELLGTDNIDQSVNCILSTGHTSGADSLLGIHYGINNII